MKLLSKLLFIGLLFTSIVHAEEYSVYNPTSQLPQPMPSRGSFESPTINNPSQPNNPQQFVSPIQSPPVGIMPTVPKDWNDKWVNKER